MAQKLAQNRQSEIIASNSANFFEELIKVCQYLSYSLIANAFSFFLVIWLFWPLEYLFLFLLSYKYVESFISGLISLNDVYSLLQYSSTENNQLFYDHRIEYILKSSQILLEVIYVVVIASFKGLSVGNFCVTTYIAICTASFLSKAWNMYKRIYEDQMIKERTKILYFFLLIIRMNECQMNGTEDCGICMMRMKVAVTLCCGHCYHLNCILEMIRYNKKSCPICKESLDKFYDSYFATETSNIIGNIMRGIMNPFLTRNNRRTEEDLNRLSEMFPMIPRADLEEIGRAHV